MNMLRSKLPPMPSIELLSVDSIEQLAEALPKCTTYFTLLLAWDAPVLDEAQLMSILAPLLDRGLVYLCAWGARCEDVHDALDSAVVEKEIASGELDYVVMTSWHANESLEESVWFFFMLAIPSETFVFKDFARYAVTVGNPEYRQRIGAALLKSEPETDSDAEDLTI